MREIGGEVNSMDVPKSNGNALVWASYHQFYIAEVAGVMPDWSQEGENNGLITTGLGCAVLHTGIADGEIELTIETYGEAPSLASSGWDDVVEVSVRSASAELRVMCLEDNPPDLPILASSGPGTYRLRVHVRGRDIATDGAPEDVTESYLIQTWPSANEREIVHQQRDEYGAGLRMSVAYNRSPQPE